MTRSLNAFYDINMAELDWRIQAASTLVHDMPSAYPGEPSHPAGSTIAMTSTIDTPSGKVAFLTPSAVAIALSVAAKGVASAEELKRDFSTAPTPSPDGVVRLMRGSATGELFDYFEQCFTATVFAYQAIEAYCNFKLAYTLSGNMTLQRKKGPVSMNREEIERQVSTSEKLATVLPHVLNRPTPKGTATWERFRELEDVRDATVHLKSHHQWGDSQKMEESPYTFFLCNSPRVCFEAAIGIIGHFASNHEREWLLGSTKVLGA
jgi:hypothetical protein